MKKYLLIGFFYIGAVSMLVMSFHFFQHELSGILKNKDISANVLYRWGFKSHIFFGIVAIFTGPAQFLTRFRNRYLQWHRGLGYVYFGAVVISSVLGLIVAQYAMGGLISTIGFTLLAVLWLSTAIAAIRAIKRKDITAHKQWMFISYGLTFGAITQRTLLLVPLLTGVPFIPIYRLSAWLPWMLNTVIAVYLFRRSQRKIMTPAV